MNPFDDLIEFIVANVKPEAIAAFRASDETHNYVHHLLNKEKAGNATEEERDELDQFIHLEHIVRMIKTKSRA